ncbi:MAG: TetR/AcrR family transcriptional regulator [Bradyrhizobium sp.]|nr:MAG: TetR/AcrR family transcriptional regulator [Bradyrhizobium sp.]
MAEEKQAGVGDAPRDARARIVDALMALAAERRFEEIAIHDIAERAGVSLADFRDAFPSKGAVLGGFTRRIDRAVLSHPDEDLAGEAPRERLFDALMRRLDAMAPYREGLREITGWLERDPLAALAMNQSLINSMRFMLETAGIDAEGVAGAFKLQGLAFAWRRVVGVWLDDEPDLAKTLAALDRALTQGERAVAGIEAMERIAAPLAAFAQAACAQGLRAGEAVRRRARGAEPAAPAGPN